VRKNTNYNSPVTDVTSADIKCNAGGLTSGTTTNTATVVAGTTIGMALDQSIYHPGPITVMLSKATGSLNSYDGSGPWFKVAEMGATITTAAITFPASNLAKFEFKLPASTLKSCRCPLALGRLTFLAPGDYLIRFEHIGLHVAQSSAGAQFYIACGQIHINGPGGGSPSPTITLPGGYKASDPGILININYPVPKTYTIPGPAVWSG
jgi:hypothetical protein